MHVVHIGEGGAHIGEGGAHIGEGGAHLKYNLHVITCFHYQSLMQFCYFNSIFRHLYIHCTCCICIIKNNSKVQFAEPCELPWFYSNFFIFS